MVSVIIPNYNHEKYLRQRIESVLNQSYPDFEVILLDDCSKDNSASIISDYANHPKVSQIIINKENSGSTFKQWYKGISIAKGDYIWVAESDDYADSDFLKILMDKIQSNENLGIVYSDSHVVDSNGVIIDRWSTIKERWLGPYWNHDYFHEGIKEIERHLAFNCTINNASATLFRKDLYLKISKQTSELCYAGDWITYLSILTESNIAYIAKPLNYYRDHSNNVTKVSNLNGRQFSERILVWNFLINHPFLHLKQSVQDAIFHQILSEFKSQCGFLKNRKIQLNMFLHNVLGSFLASKKITFLIIGYFFKKIVKSFDFFSSSANL